VPTAVILLSDDSMSVDGTASIAKGSVGGKRKAGGTDTVAISSGNANKRPKKERQPHWNSLEVMVLIHAKEKEHKTYKLTTNPRENMETAAVKWTRISEDVARAGFSNYYRGPIACKDKWQSLFSDYKKIKDYRSAIGSNEDFFSMGSKLRKELTLPWNFCPQHFREMDWFVHQRPCLNPLRETDTFSDSDPMYMSPKQLHAYYKDHNIDPNSLGHDETYTAEALAGAIYGHYPTSLHVGGSAGHVPAVPPRPLKTPTRKLSCKGEDKLSAVEKNVNMKPDCRPSNTAVKRRQSSSQTKMLEVTELQGKEIVETMKKLHEVEDKKVSAAAEIASRQLMYFKMRDRQLFFNQQGLVNAIASLSTVIGKAYTSTKPRSHTWKATYSSDDTMADDDNVLEKEVPDNEDYYKLVQRKPGTPYPHSFVVPGAGFDISDEEKGIPPSDYPDDENTLEDIVDITEIDGMRGTNNYAIINSTNCNTIKGDDLV
jgi:hypothetical protein